jgi:hypothetical protein
MESPSRSLFSSGAQQRKHLVRERDPSAGGFRLSKRTEDGLLFQVDVLDANAKRFFWAHARIEDNLGVGPRMGL